MQDKVATNFRLHLRTMNRLDKLVEKPPAWLDGCLPNPVKDRTDVIERLIFLAEKHASFGLPSDDQSHGEAVAESPTSRSQKPKASRKR